MIHLVMLWKQNNKIKILSDNGYNVDNYNLTIQSIIDSCNNNVTTIKQGNAQVQIKNMNADAMYDEALKKLKDLENEIANEDVYIKMKKTYESILELSKWNGHLYNWYNIETLEPLIPKYVRPFANIALLVRCFHPTSFAFALKKISSAPYSLSRDSKY